MSRPFRTGLLTTGALAAFAANSVLCRLALGAGRIDAGGFTLVRIAAGALMLLALRRASRDAAAGHGVPAPVHRDAAPVHRDPAPVHRDRLAPALLFLYAASFSFAYRGLTAGTGALILFGSVQATMMAGALRAGERPRPGEAAGWLIALAGLGYLVSPGLSAPPLAGSALMALAGAAWGVYSLRGRGSRDPLGDTAANFTGAIPYALLTIAIDFRALHLTPAGLGWAILSGAVTSGIGYILWFAALRDLTRVRAATVQLAVPVLAAAGGVVALGESVSPRLVIAAVSILGGIGIALAVHSRASSVRSRPESVSR